MSTSAPAAAPVATPTAPATTPTATPTATPTSRSRLKVVVRHLPPSLPAALFFADLARITGASLDTTLLSARYAAGHVPRATLRFGGSGKRPTPGAAYLEFRSAADVQDMARRYAGHGFVDSQGTAYPVAVEYALWQRRSGVAWKNSGQVPPRRAVGVPDPTAGTLEKDGEYRKFLAMRGLAPPAGEDGNGSAEPVVVEVKKQEVATPAPSKPSTTPLIEYLQQQRASKSAGKASPAAGKSVLARPASTTLSPAPAAATTKAARAAEKKAIREQKRLAKEQQREVVREQRRAQRAAKKAAVRALKQQQQAQQAQGGASTGAGAGGGVSRPRSPVPGGIMAGPSPSSTGDAPVQQMSKRAMRRAKLAAAATASGTGSPAGPSPSAATTVGSVPAPGTAQVPTPRPPKPAKKPKSVPVSAPAAGATPVRTSSHAPTIEVYLPLVVIFI
ncbi:hypothetical protein AMAG_03924 [Allomyces macrogynus ATCC 38327]|uniref:UPF3 domain-containing protein n=1 Tax=Allomyces macrogynus (strain ATCC 38327) TaxID=578462 RepID=A0A0L0S7K6_ALLM3|nr:hypothetical protein AMAG_03924 [Allomyces macrogynus ATCC 38327]|eukprot:KNE58339.1 hypothetical protein AMAG_03924 [Allomyces macrogynus ATCC 38327]